MAALSSARLRCSSTLVAHGGEDGLVVWNYLLRSPSRICGRDLDVAVRLIGWTRRSTVLRRLTAEGAPDADGSLRRLLAAGVLLLERSALARKTLAVERTWRWGPVSGAFLHSARDLPYAPTESTRKHLVELSRIEGQVATRAPPGRAGRRLPAVRARSGALAHLVKRRSEREFSTEHLSLPDVSDILFSGLGVRAIVKDRAQGDLVYKLAPSPGARNSIDGYLYARRIRGLPPGVYRYDGLGHVLYPAPGRLARTPPGILVGGQEWANEAAAVVFLVATFGRMSWKYRNPADLRGVLIEAGHVAQNLFVTACDLGLAATPTCAFANSLAEAALGIEHPDRALVHAVVLGVPDQSRRERRARNSASGG